MRKTIADFTDKELADMVRNSTYAQGTAFDQEHARFLLVLAVPYGPEDGVESLPEAIEGFRELLTEYDWEERRFQVYDHEAQQPFYETAYEELDDEVES